jgi:hypothetical protein
MMSGTVGFIQRGRRDLQQFINAGVIRGFAFIACVFAVATPSWSGDFQNLGFEEYSGGPTLPHWQLVMWSGVGELLYKGDGPGNVFVGPGRYPFVGAHIGGGPLIVVTPDPHLPFRTPLEGKGIYLSTFASGDIATEAEAKEYVNNVPYPGLAQVATIPSWAKSFWIASAVNETTPTVTFSGHELAMNVAPNDLTRSMLQRAGIFLSDDILDILERLFGGPGFPGTPASWKFNVGNIESISGRVRELVIASEPAWYGPVGDPTNPDYYVVGAPEVVVDMIVFSPFPWSGPPVNVPEPDSIAVLLCALIPAWARRLRARQSGTLNS